MCDHEHEENKFLLPKIALSMVLFVLGYKFQPLFYVAYILIGYDVLLKALKNIFKGHLFDENFLMTLATLGAISIKELPEAAMVMLLYQIGEFLQDKAVDKSKDSITELMDIRPDYANKIVEDKILTLKPEEISIGDVILVKSGEKIPLDGVITDGYSEIDTSSLTGESLPREVSKGQNVNSGCINLSGSLKIKVTKTFENSTVAKILKLTQEASNKKTKTENFITRFAKVYTPFVVVLALFIAFVMPVFLSGNWFERALTFLVISCPCALVISVPLSFFMGIGASSKQGILVKGSTYLEKLSKVKNVVFDKTGTLTNGSFEVVEINSKNPDILKYAACAEFGSNHPIAKAIKKAYGKEIPQIETFEISGKGVKAKVDNHEVLVGNKKLIGLDEDENSTDTIVYVVLDDEYIGNIIIEDTLKEDSKETIEKLNAQKIDTTMLTGDIKSTALKIQNKLQIKQAFFELLPNEKVEKLEEIMAKTKATTVFVGDGINDAPVLSLADVGVAMGGLGADAALEAADVVIMDDKPSRLLDVMKISKKTMQIAKQNIIFALSVKALFLILSALGLMTMWGAVFSDVGVTLLAVLNALRIVRG